MRFFDLNLFQDMIEINRFVHAVIDLWLRQSKKALPIRLDDFGRPQQEFLDFLKGFFVLARARMLLLALIEIASVLLCCKPLAISPLCPAPVASFAALRHSTLE